MERDAARGQSVDVLAGIQDPSSGLSLQARVDGRFEVGTEVLDVL